MKKSIIIFIASIMVVLIIGFVVFYFAFFKNSTNNEDSGSKTTEKKPEVVCSELKADGNVTEGKAPFAPVLRSKLSGKYDQNNKTCLWSVDGASAYASYPVKGECVYGGNGLMTKGEHEISYKLSTLSSCGSKIKVNVK